VFGDAGQDLAILIVANSAFASYDLTTSIGPITGQAFINPGHFFSTSAGGFMLTTVAPTASFQAVVPEPSAVWLLAVGPSIAERNRRQKRERKRGHHS
jgi:hypothetical protein